MFRHQFKPITVFAVSCTIAISVSAIQTPRMVEARTTAGSLTTSVVLGRLTPAEIELNGGSLFVRTSKTR